MENATVRKNSFSAVHLLNWVSAIVFTIMFALVTSQAFLFFHKRNVHEATSYDTTSDDGDFSDDDSAHLSELPSGAKFACVYHRYEAAHISPGEAYSPQTFPFSLCHFVLFCCIEPLAPPDDTELTYIRKLKNLGEQRTLHVVFGGTKGGDIVLTQLLGHLWEQSQFVDYVFDIRRRVIFDGVYLYWKVPQEVHRRAMTVLADRLRRKLSAHGLRLGLILDGRRDVTRAFHFIRLLMRLGPQGIVVAPPSFPPESFSETKIYHGQRTLSAYARIAKLSGNFSGYVCHTVSLAGVTFNLSSPSQSPTEGQVAHGPGEIGASKGFVSYTDACRTAFDEQSKHDWATVGVRGFTWATFLEPSSARKFFADLASRTKSSCLGFWNPEFDDVSGACGHSEYPIMRSAVTGKF